MLYLIYIYNGWNALCSLSAGGLLWVRNGAQKGSVKSVSSVREKPPQRVACVSSHRVGVFYFSQIYTEEQNTQRPTETLSQPISQNFTAKISYNVLWILYAGDVLWDRNCAQKGSVRSVSSVRERNTHSERKNYPQWEKEQPKNLVSRPIGVASHTTPLPTGEGTGEGPAGEGRRTCWGREADQLFSVSRDPYKDSSKGAKKKLRNLITKRF